MIHQYSGKLSSEECKILASLNASVRQGTPLESTKTVDEVAQSIEDLSSNDAFQIIAASDEKGKIIGWIYYYTAFRLMTFISGFYPVVDKQREEIALALIEASKKETI